MVGPIVVHETRKPGGGGGGNNANALAMINQYTVTDPTLPYEEMFCPNERCPSHPGASSEEEAAAGAARRRTDVVRRPDVAVVVIVRTHYQRQEFAFVCTECQHKWTTSK